MTTDATTAGDLAADRAVVTSAVSDMAHLADADCTSKYQLKNPRETTAGVLWHDTPLCKECRGVPYRDRSGGVNPVVGGR